MGCGSITDDPDIVKELREAEKLGILQSKVQNAYEKLQNRLQSNSEELLSQNEPLTKSSDKISIMLQDDIENIKKYDEPISLKEKYQTIFENYILHRFLYIVYIGC